MCLCALYVDPLALSRNLPFHFGSVQDAGALRVEATPEVGVLLQQEEKEEGLLMVG